MVALNTTVTLDVVNGQMVDSTVALFPGQGSITHAAGVPWQTSSSWSLVQQVSDATNVDVADLLLHSSDEEIVRTDRAQLATFTLSLVGWYDYLAHSSAPQFVAGHSLGEFSALVAAGVLTLDDGARLVSARGAAMQRASLEEPGSMVALMGPSDDALANLDQEPDLWIANVNGTGQIVVSGTRASLDHLLAHAREMGFRRATPLTVGGAFHSPLMSSAQDALDQALDDVTFHETEFSVAANVDGAWRHGGDQWRTLLSQQLTSPVQFLDIIEALPSSVTNAVELPPSGVLTGLAKRIREFDAIVALSAPGAP